MNPATTAPAAGTPAAGPQKIRERTEPHGFAGVVYVRVRVLEPGEALPYRAEVVDQETVNHDWQEEKAN